MKRQALTIAFVAAMVFAGGLLFWAGTAEAQRPAGMGGQEGAFAQRMVSSDVSALWVELCFEIKVSDEQLTKLRPTFQKEWDKRKEMAKGVTSMEAMQALRPKIQEARKAFFDAVNKELTEEQQKALAEWQKEREEQAGRFGGDREGGGVRPRGTR